MKKIIGCLMMLFCFMAVSTSYGMTTPKSKETKCQTQEYAAEVVMNITTNTAEYVLSTVESNCMKRGDESPVRSLSYLKYSATNTKNIDEVPINKNHYGPPIPKGFYINFCSKIGDEDQEDGYVPVNKRGSAENYNKTC